jgi:hypothetical protein
MPKKTERDHKKQLIVVVHGVGIRAAGESADLVAGALAESQDTKQPGEGNFRRRSSDDFRHFEAVPGDRSMVQKSYPARVTRFRRYKGKFPAVDSDERIVSDFYWGDVGGFASSTLAVLVGLGRIMLGLAHVVRENALSVFPDTEARRDRVWRGLARGAALAIHGPIFALNITLFIGLIWIVVLGTATAWVSIATALSCFLLSYRLQTHSRTFLLRHMGAYLGLGALSLLAFALLDWFAGGRFELPWIDPMFREALCSWKTSKDSAQCDGLHAAGPFLHAMRLQGVMVLLWAWVAMVTLVFGVRHLFARSADQATHRRDLLMPTLSLMTLLWFLLIGLAWAAVAETYGRIGPGVVTSLWAGCDGAGAFANLICGAPDAGYGRLFTTSLRGVWAAIAALVLVALVAIASVIVRARFLRNLAPETYLGHADQNADRARLAVHPWIWAALGVMPVFILALIVASAVSDPGLCAMGGEGNVLCFIEGTTTWFLTYLVAAVVFFAPMASGALKLGMNVAGDVIIYLNDFHWRRSPGAEPTRTFAEAIFPGLERKGPRLRPDEGYAFRTRIQNRLSSLVEDLIKTEEPDQVDFVAHSQGTVIALDVLSRHGGTWAVDDSGRERTLTLVTMGSPWRHLYHRYFPHAFGAMATPPDGVSRWTNIFRIDDFVGTHVRVGSSDEHPIGPGGHTNYWSDGRVGPILVAHLGS